MSKKKYNNIEELRAAKKLWREANKEKIKLYREVNKIKIKAIRDSKKDENKIRHHEYYLKNKEKIKNKTKNWKLNNPERKKELNKIHSNKTETKETKKKWREINKDKLRTYFKNYIKNKRKDPIFKLKSNLRKSIAKSFRTINMRKNSRTHIIVGCSFEELKQHLEKQFLPWMNWDNHGLYNGILNYGWDIDHITPLSSAKTEEDVIKLNHYSNLQPLCSYTNRHIKKDNY